MSSTFTRSAARCTSQPQVLPAHIRSYQSRDKPSLQAGSRNRWTPFLDDRRFRIRSLIGSSAGEFSPIIRYVTVSARTGLASRCLLSLTMLLLPMGCSVFCTVRRHTRAILHLAHAETLGFRDRLTSHRWIRLAGPRLERRPQDRPLWASRANAYHPTGRDELVSVTVGK